MSDLMSELDAMYICSNCADAHKLNTRTPTTGNGVCEICFKPNILSWTDELFRTFPGEGLPTTEEQIKARASNDKISHTAGRKD